MKVLIVDDDKDFADSLAEELKYLGLETYSANDAAEANAIMEFREVDAVITDVRMPKMDGLTFIRESKKKNPNVRMFLMTGNLAMASAAAAMDGVEGSFEKPVEMGVVLEKLHGKAA